MKELKEIKNLCSGNMISNGNFEYLGHANLGHKKNLLTFCDDIKYLPVILKNKCVSSLITFPEHIDSFRDKNIGLIKFLLVSFDSFIK